MQKLTSAQIIHNNKKSDCIVPRQVYQTRLWTNCCHINAGQSGAQMPAELLNATTSAFQLYHMAVTLAAPICEEILDISRRLSLLRLDSVN